MVPVSSKNFPAKGGFLQGSKLDNLGSMNQIARKDSYKLFCEQSPLARTKAEIVKSVEAAAEYRISVLTNVSIFGMSLLQSPSPKKIWINVDCAYEFKISQSETIQLITYSESHPIFRGFIN